MTTMKEHYYWIDWMKVIGMYFIIAGHIFPIGNKYIYVFSVPLFFMMSGFLGKKEEDKRVFWKKLCHNLILPCIIICVIMHLESIVATVRLDKFMWAQIPQHIFNCLIGNQGNHNHAGGLGVCWFIYTLALCKVFHQFVSDKPILQFLILTLCIVVAVIYNKQGCHFYNAAINTSLAYPMFVIGCGLQWGGGGKTTVYQ